MIELWEQALLPFNLPLTVLMGLVAAFWLLSVVGAVDVDTFDTDFDIDADGDTGGGNVFDGVLKFVNAQDVPIMIVLSLLALFMWLVSIGSNFYLNPEHEEGTALALLAGNLVVSVLAVKGITQPLRPLFRVIKQDQEHHEPLVGSSGQVKSRTLDQSFGQCEIVRPNGAPALLNCRLASDEEPLARGQQILVIDYDDSDRKFIVKPLNITQ